MKKEINLTSSFINNEITETIYFGGGTPSLLSTDEIKSLLISATENYNIAADAEITLEANPDDITKNKLHQWKAAGINRLSIGIQSFKQEDLQWMNRAHNAVQALQCINMAREEGFTNFSIDLIYGTPTLSDDDWKSNVQMAIALKVPHISCYALTVEPATALQKMIAQKKKEDVDADKQANHFLMLMAWLQTAGYEHYEISNFALPGFRSKHNSSYWQGKHYIGIGPSAHSYFGNVRKWNVSNNALYIKSLQENLVPYQEEKLSVTQQLNEYIMTSLRTIEGLNLSLVTTKFGEEKSYTLLKQSEQYLKNKNLIVSNDKLILTTQGKFFADGIAADLFF